MNILIRFSFFTFLLSTFFITACEKDDNCEKDRQPEFPVYFQFEYENFAWGHVHAGWFIDNAGNFNYYNLPAQWIYPEANGHIDKADLISNFHAADTIIFTMSLRVLQEKVSLIAEVDVWLSPVKGGSFDGGSSSLYCYRWDAGKMKYQRILLSKWGDLNQHNLDPEAKELNEWLGKVGAQNDLLF